MSYTLEEAKSDIISHMKGVKTKEDLLLSLRAGYKALAEDITEEE